VAAFRVESLEDVRLGPMLDGLIQIASRHGIRLPASLALAGKAFGQMQLAVAQLEPTLDPFKVAGSFLLRNFARRLLRPIEPQQLYYEGQKLRLRLVRLIEAVERATGARPGAKLQIDFGASSIESTIRRVGRQLAIAAGVAGSLVAAGTTSAAGTAGWIPTTFGVVAGVFGCWLAFDVFRSR
jgi:ubiquinone biosynthesis protein